MSASESPPQPAAKRPPTTSHVECAESAGVVASAAGRSSSPATVDPIAGQTPAQPAAAILQPTGSADLGSLLAPLPEAERPDDRKPSEGPVLEPSNGQRAGVESEDVEMVDASASSSTLPAEPDPRAEAVTSEPATVVPAPTVKVGPSELSEPSSTLEPLSHTEAFEPAEPESDPRPALREEQAPPPPPPPPGNQPSTGVPAAPSTATQSSEPIDTVSPVLPAESFPRPPAFALSLTLQAPPATAPSYPVSTEAAHPVSASAAPSLSAVSSDAGAVVGASSSAGCLHDSSVPALPLASGSAASKGLLVPVDPSAPLRDQDVEMASADLPSTGDGGAPGSNPSRDAQSASSPSVPQPTPSTGSGSNAVAGLTSAGAAATPARASVSGPPSTAAPLPPSVSTLAGRKIRTFPPKKPRPAPAAPNAVTTTAETASAGGSSATSSAVGTPRSLSAGLSPPLAQTARFVQPSAMPSPSAAIAAAVAPTALMVARPPPGPPSAGSSVGPHALAPPAASSPAAPGIAARPPRPPVSGTIAQVAAFLAAGRHSPSFPAGVRSPSNAGPSAPPTWAAPAVRTPPAGSSADIQPGSASSPAIARPAPAPASVGPGPLRPPQSATVTPQQPGAPVLSALAFPRPVSTIFSSGPSSTASARSPAAPPPDALPVFASTSFDGPSSSSSVAGSSFAPVNAIAGPSTAPPTRTQAEIAALADVIFRKNLERLAGLRAAEDAKAVARAERKERNKRKAEEQTFKRAAKAQRKEERQAQASVKGKGKAARRSEGEGGDGDTDADEADASDDDDESGHFASGSEIHAPERIPTPPPLPPRRDIDGNEIPRRKVGRPRKSEGGAASDAASTPSASKGKSKPKKPVVKQNILMDTSFMPPADLFPSDEEPLDEELIMEGWPAPPPPRAPSPPSSPPPPPKKKARHLKPKPTPSVAGPKKPSTAAAVSASVSSSSGSPTRASVSPAPGSSRNAFPAIASPRSANALSRPAVAASRPAVAHAPAQKSTAPAAPARLTLVAGPSALATTVPPAAIEEQHKPARVRRRALPGVYIPPPPKARKSKVLTEEPSEATAGSSTEGQLADVPQANMPGPATPAVKPPYVERPSEATAVSPRAVSPAAPASGPVVTTGDNLNAKVVEEAGHSQATRSPGRSAASPAAEPSESADLLPDSPPSAPHSPPVDSWDLFADDDSTDVPLYQQLGRSAVLPPPPSKTRTPTKKRVTTITTSLKASESEAVDALLRQALASAAVRAPPVAVVDPPAPVNVAADTPPPALSTATEAVVAGAATPTDPPLNSASVPSAATPAVPSASGPPSPAPSEAVEATSKSPSSEALVDDDDLLDDADLVDAPSAVNIEASEGEEEQEAKIVGSADGSMADADETDGSVAGADADEPMWEEEVLAVEDAPASPEEEELIMEKDDQGEIEVESPVVASPGTRAVPAAKTKPTAKPSSSPQPREPSPDEELVLEVASPPPSPTLAPESLPSGIRAPQSSEAKQPDVRPRSLAGVVPTASTRRTRREPEPEPEPEVVVQSPVKAPDFVPTASTRRTKRESAPPVALSAPSSSATEGSSRAESQPAPTAAKRRADATACQPGRKKSSVFPFGYEKEVPAAPAARSPSPLFSVAGASDDGDVLQVASDKSEASPDEAISKAMPANGDADQDGVDVALVDSDDEFASGLIIAVSASPRRPSLAKGRTPSPTPEPQPPFASASAVVAVASPSADASESVAGGAAEVEADADLLIVQPSPPSAVSTAHSSPALGDEELVVHAPPETGSDTPSADDPDQEIFPASLVAPLSAASSAAVPSPHRQAGATAESKSRSPSSRRLLEAIGDHIFEDDDRIMHPVDGSLGLGVDPTVRFNASPSPASTVGVDSDDEIPVELKAPAAVDSDDELPPSQPSLTPARKRIKLTHPSWTEHMDGQATADLTDEVNKQAESISSQDYDNMLQMDSGRSSDSEQLTWQEWEDLIRPSKEEIEEMTAYVKERGIQHFIQHYMREKEVRIIRLLLAFDVKVVKSYRDPNLEDHLLIPVLKSALSKVLSKRNRLPQYSTWDDAVELIQKSQRIVVLSGAGISVSCGIPDFRSADGLYAKLQEEGEYDLEDPQQMFDIRYFKNHPEVFYSFAHQIYPSNFTPSPCHRWIKTLEDKGKLLRNYTQNIDTLEHKVGIKKVLQCHGSFATASCLRCRRQMPGSDIEYQIMNKVIPVCEPCQLEEKEKMSNRVKRRKKSKKKNRDPWADSSSDSDDLTDADRAWAKKLIPAIIKPDITFFGEELDDRFDKRLQIDRESVDLLIVIGSSLSVAPVSDLLAVLPHSVPQIMINKTAIRNYNPDINLVGDADGIILLLAQKLGWTLPAPKGGKRAISLKAEKPAAEPRQLGKTNYWIFKGASRSDLLGTVMKTLPKDVDISWVQSDDDEGEGSDEDMLEVESDDGEHADPNEGNHHDDAANRDRDLSDHELSTPPRPPRSSRSIGGVEEDVMEEVPDDEPAQAAEGEQGRAPSPVESLENETPNDGRPVWDLIEFDSADERTPVKMLEPKRASAEPKAALPPKSKMFEAKAPIPASKPRPMPTGPIRPAAKPQAKRPIVPPAPDAALVESDDEENVLVVGRYLRSSPVDPPRRPVVLESSHGKLRAALSSGSESDDVLALKPASSTPAGPSSAAAVAKRKRRSSTPRHSPDLVAGPSRLQAEAPFDSLSVRPAPARPVRRSAQQTASSLADRPSSGTSTMSNALPLRPSTSVARPGLSRPAPPPQVVNFCKIDRPTVASLKRKEPEVVELDSDEDGSVVMME